MDEIQTGLKSILSRLHNADGLVNDCEDRGTEIPRSEEDTEKQVQTNANITVESWVKTRQVRIGLIGIPNGKARDKIINSEKEFVEKSE